jgi:phage N-6-adenine-methyltransferase
VPSHAHSVLTSSVQPNWRTPTPLFDRLNKEFRFDYDLAADAANRLCPQWFGPGGEVEDALELTMLTPGTVGFLNPPYSVKLANALGKEIKALGSQVCDLGLRARKRALEIENWAAWAWGLSFHGATIVAVLPAAIQTEWWRKSLYQGQPIDDSGYYWHRASEIRIIPHRVQFDPPPGVEATGGATVNTAIVIFRPFNDAFVEPWAPQWRYWDYR